MIVGYSTASSSAAFGVCTKINEEEMGIAPSVHRIGYPIGIIMYATVNAMSFVLTGMFAAEAFGAASSLEWFVMLWFVGTVVSIATPPVAGGTLACIGIMLTQLGVEGQALAISGVLIMLLDFIATGTRLGMLHMELALQADYLGLLDKDTKVDLETVIFNGLNLRGIYGRKVWDTWIKMTMLMQAGLDISQIITHRIDVRDFDEGFRIMLSGQSGKVIMDWSKIGELPVPEDPEDELPEPDEPDGTVPPLV